MADKTPIKMLHDRVLVEVDKEAGERRSTGGIVIPATAAMGGWLKTALGTQEWSTATGSPSPKTVSAKA